MTPEDYARAIMERGNAGNFDIYSGIVKAIAAAVLAERDACEKICDTEMTRQNIAAAIRARKDVTK